MKKTYLFSFVIVVTVALIGGFYYANNRLEQNNSAFLDEAAAQDLSSFSQYYRAKVVEVVVEQDEAFEGVNSVNQSLVVELLNGDKKQSKVIVENREFLTRGQHRVKVGDTIVVGELTTREETAYVMVDRYRLPGIAVVAVFFIILAALFGRGKGINALVGLAFSIFVLMYFMAPNMLAGKDPFVISAVATGVIAIVSVFLSHGFNERTTVAAVSTLLTLALAMGLSFGAVVFTQLFGFGSSDATYLQTGFAGGIDLRGLLLAGILIGTLGILDDVTTTQTATVHELRKANPNFNFRELYRRGLSVGREHIASLINTLALAYAGSSLPLFLLLTLTQDQPWWTVLNSEFVSEELIRTLLGSSALILAVPISTLLAAYYFHGITNQKSNVI